MIIPEEIQKQGKEIQVFQNKICVKEKVKKKLNYSANSSRNQDDDWKENSDDQKPIGEEKEGEDCLLDQLCHPYCPSLNTVKK